MKKITKLLREQIKGVSEETKLNKLTTGINIVCKDLGIDVPEIEYITDPEYTKKHKSFAAYSPSEGKVFVVIHNRNTADIMRSIAHELMHHKQNLDGKLTEMAGKDGDELENEANSYSGKIMRRLGREMEGIFESTNMVISEDLDTGEEITRLANDVFKQCIRRALISMVYNKGTNWHFPNIFQGLSPKYDKLNEFLRSYFLRIEWTETSSGGSSGYFLAKNNTNGTIVISHSHYEFSNEIISMGLKLVRDKETSDITDDELREGLTDVYFSIYSDRIISTFTHELQHCFDHWRSKGKYTSDNKSKEFYKNGDKITSDTETYTKYLRLHHEINARFSQAMANVRMVEINYHKKFPDQPMRYQYMVPIHEFINSFKINFLGYNSMTPKRQKYLLRRASQYYHAAKEKYDGKLKD
jgi:hypothetical protein